MRVATLRGGHPGKSARAVFAVANAMRMWLDDEDARRVEPIVR